MRRLGRGGGPFHRVSCISALTDKSCRGVIGFQCDSLAIEGPEIPTWPTSLSQSKWELHSLGSAAPPPNKMGSTSQRWGSSRLKSLFIIDSNNANESFLKKKVGGEELDPTLYPVDEGYSYKLDSLGSVAPHKMGSP